jgi:hypothetical protein
VGEVSALPAMGSVFFDRREPSRVLRVSWHPESRTYVLSIWRAGECAGTFQLPADAAPDLVHALMLPLVEERTDSS